jgi:hypothetical protein
MVFSFVLVFALDLLSPVRSASNRIKPMMVGFAKMSLELLPTAVDFQWGIPSRISPQG